MNAINKYGNPVWIVALAEKIFERTTFKLKSVRNTGYRGIIIGVLPIMLPGKNEMLARYRSPNVSCYFLPSCLEQFLFSFLPVS